jgi:hypothetical protein
MATSRPRPARTVGAALAAVLLLAACAGDDDPVEPIPQDEAAPEEESPEPADEPDGAETDDDGDDGEEEIARYAVPEDPDDLDVDYIERVLNRMEEGLVPVLRDAVQQGEVTDDLASAYAEIDADPEFHVEGWEYRLAGEIDGEQVATPIEDLEARQYRVVRPHVLADDCLVADVEYDDSGYYGADEPRWRPLSMGLVQAEPSPPVNPTPWRIVATGEEGDPAWCEEGT